MFSSHDKSIYISLHAEYFCTQDSLSLRNFKFGLFFSSIQVFYPFKQFCFYSCFNRVQWSSTSVVTLLSSTRSQVKQHEQRLPLVIIKAHRFYSILKYFWFVRLPYISKTCFYFVLIKLDLQDNYYSYHLFIYYQNKFSLCMVGQFSTTAASLKVSSCIPIHTATMCMYFAIHTFAFYHCLAAVVPRHVLCGV